MPIIVPPTAYVPGPPQIARDRIPADEQEVLLHISDLLGSLARYECQFQLALLLFDLSHAENSNLVSQVESGQLSFETLDLTTNTLSGWQMMAARDGALAIYHFGQALIAIGANLSNSPTLGSLVNHVPFRLARKSFKATFPSYDAIRHAVGHVADFAATQKKRKIHSIKGPWKFSFGRVSIEVKDEDGFHRFADNLYDRTYCVTYKGEVHKYEITGQTLGRLSKIRLDVYSAFGPAT